MVRGTAQLRLRGGRLRELLDFLNMSGDNRRPIFGVTEFQMHAAADEVRFEN